MSTMQVIGSRQASNRFGSLLNSVQTGETVTITRNDRKTAVIISPIDFELLGGEKVLLERRSDYLEKERKKLGTIINSIREDAEKNGLTEEILNDIIKNG